MPDTEFVAIDGDDVGIQLRTYIIANDIEAISTLSIAITEYFDSLTIILRSMGYHIIFCGGDSLLACHDNSPSDTWFNRLPAGPCTVSVGIGATAEYAYLALQLAKARGKNQVVLIKNTAASTIHKWGKNNSNRR